MTIRLDSLKIGDKFRCPWNGKVFELQDITPSAAWVKVEELVEKEMKDKKTGLMKLVKFTKKVNEPWSRGTKVELVKESDIIQNNQKESENENQNSL